MTIPQLSCEAYQRMTALRNSQNGFAKLLGIQVIYIGPGEAGVEMAADRAELQNPTGTTVHGGAIFTLADIASGAAAWSSGFHAATASAELHYVNPALNSKRLTAIAKAIKFGKRLFVFDVEVHNESDTLIAKGLFSYMPLERRVLEE